MHLAETESRVEQNTSGEATAAISGATARRVAYYAAHPVEIPERLRELDEEWDIERVLETGSSCLSLAGLVLGLTRSRLWLVLPLVVQGFFLQHALQGWCPPLPVLRKLGVRTLREIDDERTALRTIQGDRM